MCEASLVLLSNTAVDNEAMTHASAVLIHLAIASWRTRGRWPEDAATSAVGDTKDTVGKGCSQQLKVAASTVVESLFLGHDFGQTECDIMSELLRSFMPLPPSSSLAVCRAMMHIASPHILLATYKSDCASISNLFTGPILHMILRNGSAEKTLQLRFLSLQVREMTKPAERHAGSC